MTNYIFFLLALLNVVFTLILIIRNRITKKESEESKAREESSKVELLEILQHLEQTTLYASEMFSQAELTKYELVKRDQRVKLEMEIARKIHQSLMPKTFPQIRGYSFGLIFEPCFEIGGDFFDFFTYPESGKQGIIFADISGHGVAGALLTSMLKFLIQLVSRRMLTPGQTIVELNKEILEHFPAGFFVSCVFIVLDESKERFILVNASPEATFHIRPSGETINLTETGGRPLGLIDLHEEDELAEAVVPIDPGDTIFLLTDGIVDIKNSLGERLGRPKLIDWLREFRALPPQKMVDEVFSRAREFAGEEEVEDDIMLLAIRREPS
jgi:sigma-B regulation protein RsbU (phosphoserine phosphatase)